MNKTKGFAVNFDLNRDDNGSILVQPATGYTISLVNEIVVLMAIDFVDNPTQLQTGAKPQRVQLAMNPEMALKLATTLDDAAKLAQKAYGKKRA